MAPTLISLAKGLKWGAIMKAAAIIIVCGAVLLSCSDADKTDLKNPIENSYYFCEGKRTYLSDELRDDAGNLKVEEVKHILGFRRELVNLSDKTFSTSKIYIDGTYVAAETNDARRESKHAYLSLLNESLGDLSFFQETEPGRATSMQRTIEFNFFSKKGSVTQYEVMNKYSSYRDVFSCREITDLKELREVPNKMDGAGPEDEK